MRKRVGLSLHFVGLLLLHKGLQGVIIMLGDINYNTANLNVVKCSKVLHKSLLFFVSAVHYRTYSCNVFAKYLQYSLHSLPEILMQPNKGS